MRLADDKSGIAFPYHGLERSYATHISCNTLYEVIRLCCNNTRRALRSDQIAWFAEWL